MQHFFWNVGCSTQEAVEAEIKRLRVTLFPETKSDEYTYPSDVIRPMEEESMEKEAKKEEKTEFHDTEAYEGEEKEEWKSALMVGDWKDSLKRFREMVSTFFRGFPMYFAVFFLSILRVFLPVRFRGDVFYGKAGKAPLLENM